MNSSDSRSFKVDVKHQFGHVDLYLTQHTIGQRADQSALSRQRVQEFLVERPCAYAMISLYIIHLEHVAGVSVTQINIPDDLYTDLERIARLADRPVTHLVEDFLRDALADELVSELSAEEQNDLAGLRHLSDEALEDVARARLATPLQERASKLLAKGNQGNLTASEYSELEALIKRSDRLMLRKAEALALLNRRDIRISFDDSE